MFRLSPGKAAVCHHNGLSAVQLEHREGAQPPYPDDLVVVGPEGLRSLGDPDAGPELHDAHTLRAGFGPARPQAGQKPGADGGGQGQQPQPQTQSTLQPESGLGQQGVHQYADRARNKAAPAQITGHRLPQIGLEQSLSGGILIDIWTEQGCVPLFRRLTPAPFFSERRIARKSYRSPKALS